MTLSSRETGVIVLCSILALIATPVVAARLWTRKVLQKTFGMEDWLILVALLGTLGMLAGISIAVCVFHYDRHTWQLSPQELVNASWWLFTAEIVYIIDSWMIKIAILLFYRRLADRKQGNGFFYTLYAVMAWIMLYKTTYIVLTLLSCRPLQARWLRENPVWADHHSFTCLSERLNITIGSTISATEDMVVALLPTMILWNLKMNPRQKLAVWAIFALSMFTAVCSYIRTYFLWKAYWGSKDYIYELYWLWLLSGIELTVAIICASAPALKAFLSHFKIGHKIWAPVGKVTDRVTSKLNTIMVNRSHTADLKSPKKISFARSAQHSDGVFDGSTHGGMPTTQSYVAQASWNKSPHTTASEKWFIKSSSREASQDTDEPEDVEAVGRLGRSQSTARPGLPDGMWISVRSSITIDQELSGV